MNFLDSSRLLLYDLKIVKCGDFLQVYYYQNKKNKSLYKNKNKNSTKYQNIKDLNINDLKLNIDENKEKSLKIIRDENIIRTKLNCQRIAKANSNDWCSFITLTYAENMQDMKQAKIDLNFFIKNIKKVKRDFKYIAIPEFQKRGAIHFHLLTNISLQDNFIIKQQKNNPKYYDVKYWNKGFTSVEEIKGDVKKIVGYISKYMTKDCDDRLFSVKRYTCSQNLVKPKEEFINIKNVKDKKYILEQIEDKERIYINTYLDKYNNDIIFEEYRVANKE